MEGRATCEIGRANQGEEFPNTAGFAKKKFQTLRWVWPPIDQH
jgi:hypothetical protein